MKLSIDDSDAPVFTIGQVSDMLSVQQAFLRRLDQHDVVRPARSDGGQRRYSRHQIDQVIEVCTLIDEGLTLVGISRVLTLKARVATLEAELVHERQRHDQSSRTGRSRARGRAGRGDDATGS
ncbi:MAG: MerR family transcriptional regulator, heat shock protein HspR [Pseudonocardiales bacterium]|nr:MerR family transcriptional regulator, heat shock protein HspR [Pseudonocardiales bacterium]